jgi:hypothetical protein
LYLAVFESSVSVYTGGNGDTLFSNVVIDMIPTPAGKLLGSDWYDGKSDTRVNSWDYQPYVEDLIDLGVVAFVQERSTGKILQAAVKYKNPLISVPVIKEVFSLHTYPNPAKDNIYINLAKPSENPGTIRLLDMNGRVVLTEHVPPGYQIYQIGIEHLNRGIYILYWYESDQFRGLNKIVKTE